jgi:hypothetical protein
MQKSPQVSDKNLPSLLERHWAESVLAIGAIIIAGVSLWVAYDTERTNSQLVASERQLVTENAWPFVQESYGTFAIGELSSTPKRLETVMITNAGVGPAKVESSEMFWRGRAYAGWRALAHVCCGYTRPTGTEDAIHTSSLEGQVLSPGKTIDLLYYPWTSVNSDTWQKLREIVPAVQFKICYCSVFDSCWLTVGESLHPKPVSICPVSRVPYTG